MTDCKKLKDIEVLNMLAADLIRDARLIVIKVGSSLLIDRERQRPRAAWLHALAEDLADLRASGTQNIVVSSGAVALGWPRLGLSPAADLKHKQAAAAVGQSALMQAWERAFEPYDIPVAQLLLSPSDMEAERRANNARATLSVLLEEGALPVINENDSVATQELRYGDNDRLSARVAALAGADLLLLLSDVDGFYTSDPSKGDAEHIPYLTEIDADVESRAGGADGDGVGTGGMATKMMAARIAGEHGCRTVIASGVARHPVANLQNGARATVIDNLPKRVAA